MFIQDPDYARIFTKFRCVAWQHGYALTVHGSRCRDLDLISIPWTDECKVLPEVLLAHLMQAGECHGLYLLRDTPTQKPHGRLVYTIGFKEFGDPRWIDLSIFEPKDKGFSIDSIRNAKADLTQYFKEV